MGTVKINGIAFPGDKISIIGSKIFIDGEPIDPKVVIPLNTEIPQIFIQGNVESIKTDLSVAVMGTAGQVEAGGSVICDVIQGNASAGGSITCDEIIGDAAAGGSIICDSIGSCESVDDSTDS